MMLLRFGLGYDGRLFRQLSQIEGFWNPEWFGERSWPGHNRGSEMFEWNIESYHAGSKHQAGDLTYSLIPEHRYQSNDLQTIDIQRWEIGIRTDDWCDMFKKQIFLYCCELENILWGV